MYLCMKLHGGHCCKRKRHPRQWKKVHNSRLLNPKLVKKFPSLWKETFHFQGKMVLNNVVLSPMLSCHISVSYQVSVLPYLSDGSRREEEFWLQGRNDGAEVAQGQPCPEFAHHQEPLAVFLAQTLLQWKINSCVCPG